MPGNPFQSKLNPHADEIFALLDAGRSFRQVAELLNRSHGLRVTHNAVFSFAKSRRKRRAAANLLASRSAMLPSAAETPTRDGADFDLVTWLVIKEPDHACCIRSSIPFRSRTC